jgi:hypothetical protein
MGLFKEDGSVPNEFTVLTDGWWDTEAGGVVSGRVLWPTAIIQHQHMSMGGHHR